MLTFSGLTLTYLYFQIPLMVLVDDARDRRAEARVVAKRPRRLGASTWQYWRMIALPMLWPSVARRGAAAVRQRLRRDRHGLRADRLVRSTSSPILLYAQIRGDVLHDPNLGYALALGMLVITGASNFGYLVLRGPLRTVAAMKRGHIGAWLVARRWAPPISSRR